MQKLLSTSVLLQVSTLQRVILLNLESFWCSCFMPSEELNQSSRAASVVIAERSLINTANSVWRDGLPKRVRSRRNPSARSGSPLEGRNRPMILHAWHIQVASGHLQAKRYSILTCPYKQIMPHLLRPE